MSGAWCQGGLVAGLTSRHSTVNRGPEGTLVTGAEGDGAEGDVLGCRGGHSIFNLSSKNNIPFK